ncbi:MAG TPA: hypothetical protein DEF07_05185 [Nitrosomonas sp.]|nr:hypothetical protein [Nitrosomonas sp.]
MNIIEIINNFMFLIGCPLQILIKQDLFKYTLLCCYIAVYGAVVNSAVQRQSTLYNKIKFFKITM